MSSGLIIYIITPLLSAISQLMLKTAADNTELKGIRYYLNFTVISAYALFFGCMLLNIIALQTLPLGIAGVMEALGYVYVMVLSFFFLKEKITIRKLLGNLIIVLGVIITIAG